MSAAFPESGGTYIFSKKILSVPAAFMVGWVVWFASIIASVLYALGFASYAGTAAARALSFAPFLRADSKA
jgi:amino acid transporter